LPHPILVHLAISIQNAKNNAIGAELFSNQDVALHDAELVLGYSRSLRRADGSLLATQSLFFAHCGDHARAGRGAASGKAGT